eukprot:78930-Pleurochrysis_carterae.AAC.1
MRVCAQVRAPLENIHVGGRAEVGLDDALDLGRVRVPHLTKLGRRQLERPQHVRDGEGQLEREHARVWRNRLKVGHLPQQLLLRSRRRRASDDRRGDHGAAASEKGRYADA